MPTGASRGHALQPHGEMRVKGRWALSPGPGRRSCGRGASLPVLLRLQDGSARVGGGFPGRWPQESKGQSKGKNVQWGVSVTHGCCCGVSCVPPNSHVEAIAPGPQTVGCLTEPQSSS